MQHQKAKDIEFEKNEIGDCILPPISTYRTVRQKQRVVRGYIGARYSKYLSPYFFPLLMEWKGQFTDNKIAAFPYTLAANEDQKIFDEDSVPEGFVLGDPDHLPAGQIYELYNHWLGRQRRQLPGFVILNPGPLHQAAEVKPKKPRDKGKRKMEYVDVNTTDEEQKDDDEMDDEVKFEKDFPTTFKYGPPKGKDAGPSKHPGNRQDSIPVPAPSSPPPRKKSPTNKDKTVGRKGQILKLAKKPRKTKPDADPDPPAPVQEAVEAAENEPKQRKSTKKASSTKRKADDDLDPPPAKLLKMARTPEQVPVEEPLAVSTCDQASKHSPKLTDLP